MSKDNENKKRVRSINFIEAEVKLLVSLIEKKKNIIECKKTDAVTWQDKEKAWMEVQNDFNARSGRAHRTVTALKSKYEALKHNVRKKSAQIRVSHIQTGGGPSSAPVLTEAELKAKNMILFSVDGLPSNFDSDNIDEYMEVSQPEEIVIGHIEEFEQAKEVNQELLLTTDNKTQQTDQKLEDEKLATDVVNVPATSKTCVLKDKNKNSPSCNYNQIEDSDKRLEEDQIVTGIQNTPTSWKKWNPKQLKENKHPALRKPPRKRPFEALAEKKMEHVKRQMEVMLEEKKFSEDYRNKSLHLLTLQIEE